MEGSNESFSKFKTFLDILLIRRKKKGFNVNDFKKEEFEYIQPHLDNLLPLMSIEEAQRIKIYFYNAYIFHLNNGLRIANIYSQSSLTPDPCITQDDEVEQPHQEERLEDEQSSRQEIIETQLVTIDDIELSSRPFIAEQTGPLMQSTPLLPGELRILTDKQQEKGDEQDVFVSDIMSQINMSPILTASAPLRIPNVQPTRTSTPNVEMNGVSFLRNFANIEAETPLHEQLSPQNIRMRTRKRRSGGLILPEPKKKMDKAKFDFLCCLPHKTKTDEQIKRSEEYFLYFALVRRKQENIISRNNTIIPEGERGHISLQRVNNLSNVLRAHASQSQTYVEQPAQLSQINSTRSPLTPQGLLGTSLAFTPLRGDISGFEPRMVIDQATSFPTRSLLRQQPLLPIPERESSIHIPHNPEVEELYINDPATFSNLPREYSGNAEMIGQILQVPYNEPSQSETQQQQVSLNTSGINIQQLIEHEPIFPLGRVEDQSSNVPGIIEQHQPPIDSLALPQQSSAIDCQMETHESLVPASDVRFQLQESIAQNALSLVDEQTDNLQFNWFEILRPRVDFVEYPRDGPTTRRKKRRRQRDSADRFVRPRRQYELPVIPRNFSLENLNELASIGASDQIPHPPQQVTDFPEHPLSPPARYSEDYNVISDQITQYPIQIETQLKEYLELIKRAGRKLEYVNWERFDSCLFNENDRFELYTNIFKRIIKDNYVAMDRLYEHGTTRLEAAKGFRFILDLKTMGFIEIESVETRILGIRLISIINAQKL